jgi:hypothetical protein
MHPFTRYIFQDPFSHATKATFEVFLTLYLLSSSTFVAFELDFTLLLFRVRGITISVDLSSATSTLYGFEDISFHELESADGAGSLFLCFFDVFVLKLETHRDII